MKLYTKSSLSLSQNRVTRPRPVARRPNARLVTLSHPPPLIHESPDGQPNSDKTEVMRAWIPYTGKFSRAKIFCGSLV